MRLAVNAGLLAIAPISIAIGQPFALQYAREQVPPEIAALPPLRKIDCRIGSVWALAFAAMTGADFMMARMPSAPSWLGLAITIAAIVGAVWFTRWYPAHRQRLSQGAAP